jgi:hypothetical protein
VICKYQNSNHTTSDNKRRENSLAFLAAGSPKDHDRKLPGKIKNSHEKKFKKLCDYL